jgi:DNA-binding transcriptional ArsR family regulator
MPMAQDRILFLSKRTRLRIAELCRDEPRTIGELAAALGRDPGSLSQPRTMVRRGVLKEASRPLPSGRDARTYRLDRQWRPALEEALRRAPAAVPASGQDLLLVPLSEVKRAATALAEGVDMVEWGAEVRGGTAGLLLAVRRDATDTGTVEVLDRLGDVAPSVVPLHLVRSMSAAQLQKWAETLAGGAPALPSP